MSRRNSSGAFLFTFLVGVTLLLGAAACTWQELRPGSDNTRRLYVIGNLQQINTASVAQAAQRYLGKGFFEVDVDAIQDVVSAMPWVESVSVHRRWPDAVVVRVSEHRAVARWGSDALVGENEMVFTPPAETMPKGLVMLDGPKDSSARVLAELPELQEVLAASGRQIGELRLDARGSWQAVLNDGLELRLGRADPKRRLQRFVNQLINQNGPALSSRLEDAEYVDLRYTDGFAVGGARAKQLDEPGVKKGEQHDKKA